MTVRTDEARRFLLGQLPAQEAERFEERLLADDELVGEIEAAETELYDEYVRGELAETERVAFVERFGPRPERIAFAKAFLARASSPRRGSMRWALAAAAAIIIAGSATMLWRREPVTPPPAPRASRTEAPQPPQQQRSQPPQIAKRMAVVTITLAVTRDDERQPVVELAPDIHEIALNVRLNPADRFPSYEIDVSAAGGGSVWKGPAVVDATANALSIVATIPASEFVPGDYQIAVTGIGSDGAREELGYQSIAVHGP